MTRHWISRLAELTVAQRAGEELTSREQRTLRKLTGQMAGRTGRIADAQTWRRAGNQKETAAEKRKWAAFWARKGPIYPRSPSDYRAVVK